MCVHQNGQVDDAVLLGADQFFAVDDQRAFRAAIDDAELGDGPRSEVSVTSTRPEARASSRT